MNWSVIGEAALATLYMTLASTAIAYIIGIPLGVLLNITSKKGLHPNRAINVILGTIVNIMRSMPALIIIIVFKPVTQFFFGKGGWTGEWYSMIVPLVFASFGFVARMVEQSLAEVDTGEIEAVRSLGATNWQIIVKVLLSEARSSLISGFAVSIVSIIGYTSFAGYIASGGLIQQAFTYGYYGNETLAMWICIIIVVIIVQLFQEGGLLIAKKIDKRKTLK